MKKLSPLLVFALLVPLTAGCGDEVHNYSAALQPVNGADAQGTSRITVNESLKRVTFRIRASGLEPNEIHPQELHRGGRCPSSGDDTDHNGVVDSREAQGAYGPIVRRLLPYPTVPPSGDVDYTTAVKLKKDQLDRLKPIEGRIIVLQGRTTNLSKRFPHTYTLRIPVACGRFGKE